MRDDASAHAATRQAAYAEAFGQAWDALAAQAPPLPTGRAVPLDASGLGPWRPSEEAGASGEPRRIVLLGPESAGKTWLSRALAERFAVPFVAEYLRLWVDANGLPVTLADAHAVARGQIASEAAVRSLGPRAYACDTDLWMNVVYARHFFGACPAWIERLAQAQPDALRFVLAPDVPWTPDPQRGLPDEADRWAVFDAVCSVLGAAGCAFEAVRGGWAERRETILRRSAEQVRS